MQKLTVLPFLLATWICSGAAPMVSRPGGLVFAQEPDSVIVARVTEAEINSGRRVIGTVNPLKRSTIGSAVDGRVESLNVNEGERVSQGDVLASLRKQTMQIELAGANAELDLAEKRLTELRNGSLPEEIDEAEANMQAAQAAYKNAASKLSRLEVLSQTNAASVTELEDARERADAARYTVKATEALYKRIKQGPRPESIAQAEAQVELQRQRVLLIADRIEKCDIAAPFDGIVATEFTETGAWIQQGDPVVELVQMDTVEIEAPVTADIAVNLRKGTVVRVEFPELPDQLLTGTVERIVPITATRARTFPVHLELKNKFIDGRPLLLAGMLARVDFPAGRREKLPLVPKDALVLNGANRSVFVVDSSQSPAIVREVPVELGVAYEDRIQVQGDLEVGQQVVVVGNERLVDKRPVKVLKEIESTETDNIDGDDDSPETSQSASR